MEIQQEVVDCKDEIQFGSDSVINVYCSLTDFGITQSLRMHSRVSFSEVSECKVHQSVCSSSREGSGGGRVQSARVEEIRFMIRS